MADKLIFIVTCADEKADRAIIPFALGNSALAMDVEATIVLQSTGVFLGKKDYARHINATGFPPLEQLIDIFREEGGKLYACEPCIRARNITPEDLLDHIEVVSGPTLVDGYLDAKNVIVY
jgi:uncharacterized protein involved in oxidation of intracellular sulfur